MRFKAALPFTFAFAMNAAYPLLDNLVLPALQRVNDTAVLLALLRSPLWVFAAYALSLWLSRLAHGVLRSRTIAGVTTAIVTAPLSLFLIATGWGPFDSLGSFAGATWGLRYAANILFYLVLAFLVGAWIQPQLTAGRKRFAVAILAVWVALAIVLAVPFVVSNLPMRSP